MYLFRNVRKLSRSVCLIALAAVIPAMQAQISNNGPPTLVSASGSEFFTTVRVVFSESLDQTSAETAANYALAGGITVSAAALAAEPGTPGDHIVLLTTSKQTKGTRLTLTVNNVQDAIGNRIAANSTIEFRTYIWQPGVVLHKRWNNINTRVPGIGPHEDPDETFRELETLAAFPDNPDVESLLTLWEGPVDAANEYASQIVGWFVPAETDNYVFFTNSDGPSHLYLSPDDDPANKLLIAQQAKWAGVRQWQGSADNIESHISLKRSDRFPELYPTEATDAEHEYATWPADGYTANGGIRLEAGRRYYLESVQREDCCEDNLEVTVITEAEAAEEGVPTNGTPSTLTGNLIGTYINPNITYPDITHPPLLGSNFRFPTIRSNAPTAFTNLVKFGEQDKDICTKDSGYHFTARCRIYRAYYSDGQTVNFVVDSLALRTESSARWWAEARAKLLGQLPVFLRQHVVEIQKVRDESNGRTAAYVSAARKSNGSLASGGNLITIYNDNNDPGGVMVHGLGHVYDNMRNTAKARSDTSQWRNAVLSDNRHITDYAATNGSEDFAESMMIFTLLNMNPDHLEPSNNSNAFGIRIPTEDDRRRIRQAIPNRFAWLESQNLNLSIGTNPSTGRPSNSNPDSTLPPIPPVLPPLSILRIEFSGFGALLKWSGGEKLQAASSITGPWEDVIDTISPYNIQIFLETRYKRQQFFRIVPRETAP